MSRARLTRLSSITGELDRIAEGLESDYPVVALAIDMVSDRLERQAGIKDKINKYLFKIMDVLGVKRIPTPLDAAKKLKNVSDSVLDKIGDVLFPNGILPPPPYVIAGDQKKAFKIPSELERLDLSSKRLIPEYLSVLKSVQEETGKGGIPDAKAVRDEIDRLIGEVSRKSYKKPEKEVENGAE